MDQMCHEAEGLRGVEHYKETTRESPGLRAIRIQGKFVLNFPFFFLTFFFCFFSSF